MSNRQSLIIGGLLALAIFVICNCAGYLIFSAIDSPDSSVAELFNAEGSNPIPNQEDIVAYVTPATAIEEASSAPDANTTPPQPLPLLPTVTPGGPIATPVSSPQDSTPDDSPALSAMPAEAGDLVQLQILSHKSYVDSLGWYHIVGEVQNNANVPMEFVEVIAKLYDDSDTVIGTKLTFTAPDIIFPGGRAPFDIVTLRRSQWDKIKQYRLEVKGDISETLLQQHLVLLDQNSRIQNDVLYVSGQVQNTGDEPALVKLIITLYDADRNVVNTSWGYADDGLILPENTSSFEVKIQHQTDPNNYHYSIQIEEEQVTTD